MDGYQVKQYLDAIIDRAYPDINDNTRKKYHGYKVVLTTKVYKGRLGCYHYSTSELEISGIENKPVLSLVITSIHELAHHIDWCQRNTSDHQKPFYAIYKKLLYAALDLKIFSAESYFESVRFSRDYNKVCDMLYAYNNQDRDESSVKAYKEGLSRIDVKSAFSIKDHLKERGYKYDAVTKCWYKEFSQEDIETEKRWLDSLCADYDVEEAKDFFFKAKTPIPDKWCGHQFTDSEKEELQHGKVVLLTDCVSQKSGKPFFCNIKWVGGKFDVEFLAALEIPKSWCGHVFTDCEITTLKAGSKVPLLNCVSDNDKKPFHCYVRWKNGKIIPTFINTKKVPDTWHGHTFTEEEKARLLFGDFLTLTDTILQKTNQSSPITIALSEGHIAYVVKNTKGS